ncbi:hypothetical protein BD324DRAFT_321023 [Kockovaella imperatae]|uniref:Transcription factor TFIIB cyclin-like domain-containing protein n=1 Tax=Kockovaella imperatae TaxID=4999 RepID=A0A1Y1UQ38_9TREE|nr:hypothetical protein BD324DRAFT_321023 [Kockovaella imperatae]ORX39255.1 hypothetical protein BD324DRAFT_321023 [Kockovaella imperatae]
MIAASAGPRPPVPKYGQAIPPNLNVRQLCPNCRTDPPNIVEEYSKDTRSEWRTFAGDEGGDDPSRVGDAGNALLGNLLETSISSHDGRTGMARDLQRAQARVAAQSNGSTSAVAMQAIFGRIAEMCDHMSLPRNVISRAQHVYKIADDNKLIRGPRNEMAFIAASIIIAGRNVGAERSFPEVCKVTRVGKKDLFHAVNVVKRVVTKEVAATNGQGVAGLSSTEKSAEGLLTRFINYLDLGNVIHNASKYIVGQAAAKAKIDGRNPVSIAAGVLYFTCVLFERSTTAKEIAEVAEITDGTIKLICKLVCDKLDDVIKPEWVSRDSRSRRILCADALFPSSCRRWNTLTDTPILLP